jgi:GT2 family glycosyltransferase
MSPLAIVILNWNRPTATLACLENLSHWSTLQPHIWVVDNASHDDSVALIRQQFPQVTLITSPINMGFAGGNNLALRQILVANPSHVLLLNNDVTVTENAIIELQHALEQHESIGVIGPLFKHGNQITSAGGRDLARYLNTHLRPTDLPPNTLTSNQPYSVDYVSGTVALMRGAALAQVGLFDEAYFFSGEMADWCERLKQSGYHCAITPTASAEHDTAQAGSARQTLYAYYILRNRFRFIRKFRPQQQTRLIAFWLAYGLAAMLKATLRGQFATTRATALALHHGLTGQFGGRNEQLGIKN